MSDLRELYQQLILDHNKNPRNFRVLDPADRFAEGYNPLCGDKVEVYLQLHDDRIKDFQAMLTDPSSNLGLDQMGKLFVFAGVRDYPTRIKCATLSWHALRAAIDNVQTPITTER